MTAFVTGGPPRYAHQKRILRKMLRTGGVTAVLADPGTGKTATVIDYASLLALKSPTGEARVLVACPLVAADTWVIQARQWVSPQVSLWAECLGGSVRERAMMLAARGGSPWAKVPGTKERVAYRAGIHTRLWGVQKAITTAAVTLGREDVELDLAAGLEALPSPRLIVEVINLDSLQRRDPVGGRTSADVLLEAVTRFGPDLVVVDESHRIKGASTNASRLLARIGQRVPRRMILTGTVMPTGPGDIFGQWRFLRPDVFTKVDETTGETKVMSYGDFATRYLVFGGFDSRVVTGHQNLPELQERMRPNAVVVRKLDALDLPPTTDVEVPVRLSSAEARAYANMRDQLAHDLGDGDQSTVSNVLAKSLRLRQITAGYLPSDSGTMKLLGSSKISAIRDVVDTSLAGERRLVIFAVFREEISQLRAALAAPGRELLVVTGDTPQVDRIAARKRFASAEDKQLVMIAQISTMSLAVNELVAANHALFASLTLQRADHTQACDRLHRPGQTKPVTFWYFLAPRTVDTVIRASHQNRTQVESAVLQHIKERGL